MLSVPHHRSVATASLAVAIAGFIAGSACDAFFQPCGSENFDAVDRNGPIFMDGAWYLHTVNGTAVGASAPPYPLQGTSDKLFYGSMDLATLYLDAGSCLAPKKSRGQIIAHYVVINVSGVYVSKSEVGSFEYDNDSHIVTLRALGHSIVGTASLSSTSGTIRVNQEIPFGTANKTYLLNFDRIGVGEVSDPIPGRLVRPARP